MSGFSQAELFKYLNPNFETGNIYFKFRNSTEFPSERIANGWNTRFAGKIAGSVSTNGYKLIGIKGKRLLQHRVLWFMLTGMIPVEIDHKNGNTLDNSICNLRDTTKSENSYNSKTYSCNTTGHRGVHYYKNRNLYSAQITINGKTLHLGYFKTFEEARTARLQGEEEHGILNFRGDKNE